MTKEERNAIREMNETIKGMQGMLIAQAEALRLHTDAHTSDAEAIKTQVQELADKVKPVLDLYTGGKFVEGLLSGIGGTILKWTAVATTVWGVIHFTK